MPALIDKFTPAELAEIVANSYSMREVIQKIGYTTVSGSNNKTVQSRIDKYQIDTSHFLSTTNKTVRNEANIFIEDSTASQQTLRKWYIKGQYTPYVCSICGQEPYWQGKELTLILDHINGKNHDDRLENLRWVCPNCNQQLETTGFRGQHIDNLQQTKLVEPNKCLDCGTIISQSAIRCRECANKQRIQELPISREELKQLIRTQSFTSIGELFALSDNAIRKWCIKYNLPSKKSEIVKYSDIEWELV